MAAAIILIPEMLSGPDSTEDVETAARAPSETGLKTYSIDLNNPPGEAAQSIPDERAPPPEQAAPSPQPTQVAAAEPPAATPIPARDDESNPERVAESAPTQGSPQASADVARSASATSAPVREPERAPSRTPAPPAQESTARPLASSPSVPTSRGWAVQLGSFSSLASAERLAGEYRANHGNVFVMPVKSGATTLYRVRIGPMRDRAEAEQMLRKVRTQVSGAAVVAHP